MGQISAAAGLGADALSAFAHLRHIGRTGTEPTDDPQVTFRTVGRPQRGVELTLARPIHERRALG